MKTYTCTTCGKDRTTPTCNECAQPAEVEQNERKRRETLHAPGTLNFHMSAIFPQWNELDDRARLDLLNNQWGLVAAHLKEAWRKPDEHAVNWLLSEAYQILQEDERERAQSWISYAERHAPDRVTAFS